MYLMDGSETGKKVVAKMGLSDQTGGFRNEREISMVSFPVSGLHKKLFFFSIDFCVDPTPGLPLKTK